MTVLRVINRGRQHLFEAHGAVAVEHRDPGAEESRDDPGVDALVQLVGRQVLGAERPGGRTGGAERMDRSGRLVEVGQEAVPRRAGHLGANDVEDRQHRDRSVHRVAALHQGLDPRHGREGVSRAHQSVDPRHHRAVLAPHLPDADRVGGLLGEGRRREAHRQGRREERQRGTSKPETIHGFLLGASDSRRYILPFLTTLRDANRRSSGLVPKAHSGGAVSPRRRGGFPRSRRPGPW